MGSGRALSRAGRVGHCTSSGSGLGLADQAAGTGSWQLAVGSWQLAVGGLPRRRRVYCRVQAQARARALVGGRARCRVQACRASGAPSRLGGVAAAGIQRGLNRRRTAAGSPGAPTASPATSSVVPCALWPVLCCHRRQGRPSSLPAARPTASLGKPRPLPSPPPGEHATRAR